MINTVALILTIRDVAITFAIACYLAPKFPFLYRLLFIISPSTTGTGNSFTITNILTHEK